MHSIPSIEWRNRKERTKQEGAKEVFSRNGKKKSLYVKIYHYYYTLYGTYSNTSKTTIQPSTPLELPKLIVALRIQYSRVVLSSGCLGMFNVDICWKGDGLRKRYRHRGSG
jgi:hypothetical protein